MINCATLRTFWTTLDTGLYKAIQSSLYVDLCKSRAMYLSLHFVKFCRSESSTGTGSKANAVTRHYPPNMMSTRKHRRVARKVSGTVSHAYLFCYSFSYENLPITSSEIVSCNRPVVASNIPLGEWLQGAQCTFACYKWNIVVCLCVILWTLLLVIFLRDFVLHLCVIINDDDNNDEVKLD